MKASANHRTARIGILFLVSGSLFLGQAAAAESGPAPASPILGHKEGVIVVGRASEDPKKHLPRLEKMANYLAGRLSPMGISSAAAVVAKDNRRMIGYVRDGTVDPVSESAFSAVRFSRDAGAEIILRAWKGGKAEYRTVFITRTESAIETLADLRGKTIVFEDRGSTSAFLLPLAILRREGQTVVELPSPREKPPGNKIGYAFARGEVNIVAWVVKGLDGKLKARIEEVRRLVPLISEELR